MAAEIHHRERKGFELVALAKAKPFLTRGQGEDHRKKDPERKRQQQKQTGACLSISPVASEAQILFPGKSKSLFFYMVNLTQSSPWIAAGAPPCRAS